MSSVPNPSHNAACTDRTAFFPPHTGSNVFPNSPLFSHIIRHAARHRLAIRDLRLGVQKTYEQLLSDVLGLRQVLRSSLDAVTVKDLENGEEVYIGVLAGGGYEFAVAILAVLALGAAAVPMSIFPIRAL